MSREHALGAVGWVAAAGSLGLTLSAVFSSVLRLPRGLFVLVYAIAVGALAALFFRRTGTLVTGQATSRLPVSLGIGVLLGGVLVAAVLGGPGGARPAGIRLATALGWYGIVYGVADALLLSIIPVLAVRSRWTPATTTGGRLRVSAVAFAASLLVTALYHGGFVEFRGGTLMQPLIGNAVVTSGYLLTGSLATPLLAHVLMHGAAVVHGMEVTAQLPPHY